MKPEIIGRVTFRGPAVDDPEIIGDLPVDLRALLVHTNGFVLFDGGLHVRGACLEPKWHSLREAWLGRHGFQYLYTSVLPDDIPFAQDCVGDQFLWRGGRITRLHAETDDAEDLGLDLDGFFAEIRRDPEEFLCFDPDRKLRPGELLHAFPPFCVKESEGGRVSLRAVPAGQLILSHARLAQELRDLPDGHPIRITVEE